MPPIRRMTDLQWRVPPGLVESALEQIFDRHSDKQRDGMGQLQRAMRYATCGGGKRLRSQLVLETASMVGGDDYDIDRALPTACALELIHAYSLVHDDLPAMDNADTRRGRPSCHREFGEAIAILAGDGLLTLAFETLGTSGDHPANLPATVLRVLQLVGRAAGPAGMVGGQAIDIAWSEAGTVDIGADDLLRMHALKTGALIRVACEAGALIGGGSETDRAALATYGADLGRAFQIQDDVLDVEGDPAETGKDSTDAANQKITAPGVFGLKPAKVMAREAAEAAIAALAPYGERAASLRQLAHYVNQRRK